MLCCVPGCKNDSRYSSKSQGITFHIFPNEPALRSTWLEALGKDASWEPKERSAVCSDHFLDDDFYLTRSGLRKLRAGAVPLVDQGEYGDSAVLNVCRICLVMNCQLFSIKTGKLKRAYEQLTGESLSTEQRLPQQLCAECKQRLINSSRFRLKSLRANTLLNRLLKKHDSLTTENLQSINREKFQLTSNLGRKLCIDHCDLTIYRDKEILTTHNIIPTNVKQQVKEEEEEVKEEEEEVKEEAKEEEEEEEVVFVNAFDDDFYSTDDSLPFKSTEIKNDEVKKMVYQDPDKHKNDRKRKPFMNYDLNETLFTITDLTIEEQIADIEKRQESSNFKNSVFKCMECYKGFVDKEAYNTHMSRHTTECGEHRCNICKTHFKHARFLRKHVKAHTQRISCNQCDFVTTYRPAARMHERWHKGTTYKCPHCPEMFVKFTTYLGHVRIKHPSDFVCQVCGYSFVSEKGIKLHKQLKHRLENIVIPDDGPSCELCNLRFANSDALERHIKVSYRHKEDNEKDTITPCKRRAVRDRDSKKGEDRSEKPIPCEQCGLKLENFRSYHRHFRKMHPEKNRTNFSYPSMKSPCMCEVCGRIFQSQAALKDHSWIHTEERPFQCDLCGKCFRMKLSLLVHKRHLHSAVKPKYGCDSCGKQFSTQYNRQRHMVIHTGLKPFKCETCGKCFKIEIQRRAHIDYVHLKKPWPKRNRVKRRTDGRQVQSNTNGESASTKRG